MDILKKANRILKTEPPHLYLENLLRRFLKLKPIEIEKTIYTKIKKQIATYSPESIISQIKKDKYLKEKANQLTIIYYAVQNNLPKIWRIEVEKILKYNVKTNYISRKEDLKDLIINTDYKYYIILNKEATLTKLGLYNILTYIEYNKQVKIFYTDHLEYSDNKYQHFCKPSFNIDYFLAYNYIQSPIIVERKTLENILLKTNLISDKTDDNLLIYSILLQAHNQKIKIDRLEKFTLKAIIPTPEILKYRIKERLNLISLYLKLNKINAKVELVDDEVIYINRKLMTSPNVSIIIPFKDKLELLKPCIESIIKKTQYPNYEILLISNNSQKEETFEFIKQIQKLYKKIKFFEYNMPFNYSAINNYAVTKTDAPYLLFLNNDTKVINKGWLKNMCKILQREDVGVVGSLLIYEDDSVQHAGVTIGVGHFAGHNHRHYPKDNAGYMKRIIAEHELSAVTGACLLTKQAIFNSIGGFNEINLGISNNDVDYCLKVRQKGMAVIYTPWAKLYHYESKSRSYDLDKKNIDRYEKELLHMKKKYQSYIDPFYNESLTKKNEDFSLK